MENEETSTVTVGEVLRGQISTRRVASTPLPRTKSTKRKDYGKVALGFTEVKRKGLKVTHILCGSENGGNSTQESSLSARRKQLH